MGIENTYGRQKSFEDLSAQLGQVEETVGRKLVPETDRSTVLTMPLAELKERYPSEYQVYLESLRIGTQKISLSEQTQEQSYSESDIARIQRALAGEEALDRETLARLETDPAMLQYSIALFFPVVGERLRNKEEAVASRIRTGARERALKIEFLDQTYVIKTLENSAEAKIAQIAGEAGIGPKQFPSLAGFLTEEWLEGNLITHLRSEDCTPAYMKGLGHLLGDAIKTIHENRIVIGDQLLSDDMGKSHMVVEKNGDVHIIDFGAAVDVSNFPNLTDEEVLCLMRTDATIMMRVAMTGEDPMDLISSYRGYLVRTYQTGEELMKDKDIQLLKEGLYFLSMRVPNVAALSEGIFAELDASTE